MDTELPRELVTSSPKTVLERAFGLTNNCLSDFTEQLAGRSIGQFLFQKTEDVIWAFEKSIEWSVPVEVKKSIKSTADEKAEPKEANGSRPAGDTTRPLPWIVFIPVLFVWRVTRMVYETVSSLLGKVPINPKETVSFLRNQRRALRAVRIRGKRNMKTKVNAPGQEQGIYKVFSKVASYVLPSVARASAELAVKDIPKKQENKKDLEVGIPSPSEDDEKENVYEKLNRFSQHEDTVEDDPDFEPNSSFMSSEETVSSDADVSEGEGECDLPPTKTDVQWPSRTASFIAEDIIHEEAEDSEDSEESSTYEEPGNCIKLTEENDATLNSSVGKDGIHPRTQHKEEQQQQEDIVPKQQKLPEEQQKHQDVQPADDEQKYEKGYDSVSLSLSLSSKSSDVYSSKDFADASDNSHDSAIQKISNIFKKKHSLTQSSV